MYLELNCKPISLNQTEKSTRGGRRYKSKGFKLWEPIVQNEICRYENELYEFATSFGNHLISVHYEFFIDNMYVKSGKRKGLPSLTCGDVDNFIKPINDEIFGFLESINENINDSFVSFVSAKKSNGTPKITAKFFLLDKEC